MGNRGSVVELLSVVLLALSAAVRGVKFNRADKLRANSFKNAKLQSRIRFKQQNLPSTRAHTPSLATAATAMKKEALTKRLSSDFDVLQMFVRRTDSGPWSCFQEISADGSLQSLTDSIIVSGGLQAEILRQDLEDALSTRLFGERLGDEDGEEDEDDSNSTSTSINNNRDFDLREIERMLKSAEASREKLVKKAKEALPAFRKIHSREIQFGYRILAESEAIYPLHYSKWAGVDYDDERGAFFWNDGEDAADFHKEDIPIIEMDILLKDPTAMQFDDDSAFVQLDTAIREFADSVLEQQSTPSREIVDMQSPLFSSVNPQLQVSDIDVAFDLYVCSDGSAHIQQGDCTQASAGVYAVCVSPKGKMESLSIRVSDIAGFVLSPFDAELAGSLAAVIVCRRLIAKLSGEHKGRITFLTDSKTLTRSLRMGPTSNQFTERSTPSRLAAWDAIMDHVDALAEEEHAVSVRWIPGHPERRHTQLQDWTYFDGAIFAADRLAAKDKSGEETEMYGDVWRALGTNGDSSRSVKASEIRFLELIVKDSVQ